jgi:60 kDa SS-A/Ro ribonucleoprotein
MSEATNFIASRITDANALKHARVHPIALLGALGVYQRGRGEKGSLTWSPVPAVVDALDRGFYAAFGAVASSGKRWLLALDVSGSMGAGQIAGMPGITPRVASAAMALVTAAVEPSHAFVGFTANGWRRGAGRSMHGASYPACISPLDISPRQRVDDVVRHVSALPMGGTDCALPMLWAAENRVDVDAFVVYTDNETWAGDIHPVQALRAYREKTGIAARLIVVGMTATQFTIADPSDAGMLDVVGFDTAAPEVMRGFVA